MLPEDAHVCFVRTPRYLWPFNSQDSAFWPPLGFCSLAAVLRQRFPRLRLSIIDCPAQRIGWQTLEARLRRERPAVIGIGEETVSALEGRRLAALAKMIDPEMIVIAGGVYFSYAVAETFADGHVDYIVRGEGEETLAALFSALIAGDAPEGIAGLASRLSPDPERIPFRKPIMNMNSLPRPAYDLLDIQAYGARSRNHARLATLEHSRGCVDQCRFCILWKHFGRNGDGRVHACYRTKSPERTFDEVCWLARDYDRYTLHFVDPTFNVASDWTDRFAELMLRGGPPVQFTAWLRADGIVRDEHHGVLEKLVRAGLVQAYIGIERGDSEDLRRLGKHNSAPEVTREALEIMRRRYPQVFMIGTVMYGLPWESRDSLRRLRDLQYDYPLDYAFYIPVAPSPGTDIRDDLTAHGCALSENLRDYNFFTPVTAGDRLSRRDLENFYSDLLFHVSRAKLRCVFQAYRKRTARVRRVYRNLLGYAFRVAVRQLWSRITRRPGPTLYAAKPDWYDS